MGSDSSQYTTRQSIGKLVQLLVAVAESTSASSAWSARRVDIANLTPSVR
jgi:hypothetical protein